MLSLAQQSLVSIQVILMRHADLGATSEEFMNDGLYKITPRLSAPNVRCLQLQLCG